jgi:hypothetical protein
VAELASLDVVVNKYRGNWRNHVQPMTENGSPRLSTLKKRNPWTTQKTTARPNLRSRNGPCGIFLDVDEENDDEEHTIFPLSNLEFAKVSRLQRHHF